MKKLLFFIMLFGCKYMATAQLRWDDYSLSYNDDKNSLPTIISAIRFQSVVHYFGSQPLDSLLNDSLFRQERTCAVSSHYSHDTAKGYYFVSGIDQTTAANYQFRVLINAKSELIPWSDIKEFTAHKMDIVKFQQLGFKFEARGKAVATLGGFSATPGKFIVIDVREKKTGKIIDCAVTFWVRAIPRVLDIFTNNEFNELFKKLRNPWPHMSGTDNKKWKQRYPADQIDSISSLPKKLFLPAEENNVIFFLKRFFDEPGQLEYQVIKDGAVYSEWKQNDFDVEIIWLKDLPPGDYQLKMRYVIQRGYLTTYPFEIKPRWDQTSLFKIIAGGLIAAFFGFIILLLRSGKQRKKLRLAQLKKEQIENELKSIRSQLNPHFVFNALNSIQGLINNNSIEKANYYLSGFSNLLRESLVNHEKHLLPLQKELELLETYIQLEQMRFPFSYNISVDENLDSGNIEIPSLLLQPLVENSIKHGISQLYEKGTLHLEFRKENKNLISIISDNGKGFEPLHHTDGYGLKLTKERIDLMNQSNPEQLITMDIISKTGQGTTIRLNFNNWL